MKIEKANDGTVMTVELIGEVDASNASKIEADLLNEIVGVKDLTFDLAELEYISSTGLRILLLMQKMMKAQGSMTIKNVRKDVMDIFRVAGFVRLLNIV
ncbi:MAG: STAS domain-containing protein [Ruminiclostridium sp.]|nr:STAS domain-containing protein [Ruminiclostridium sp.]